MSNIISKYAIIVFLSVVNIFYYGINDSILPILLTITVCGFLEYIVNDKAKLFLALGFIILSIFYCPLIIFTPVIIYDFLLTKYQPFMLLSLVPVGINYNKFSYVQLIIFIAVIACCLLLKKWNAKIIEMKSSLHKQRDDMTEQSINMQRQIDELTSQQDSECNLAALNERNRIAREIHDNVGHLLSSSILQIAAIMAITKDEKVKANLAVVKSTLDEGMNSIRKSVHNLNNESIDLFDNIKKVTDDFKFCKIELSYNYLNDPPASIKYAEIAIVKEALNNVIKHSNATLVTVNLIEHPSLYQMIIQDNGTNFKSNPSGMGLENIRQRVENLKGIVNFETIGGFKIFISFNKLFLEE